MAKAPVVEEDEISQPEYVVPEGKLTLELTKAEKDLPGYKPGAKSVKLYWAVQDDEWQVDGEDGPTPAVIQSLVSQTLGVSKAQGPSNLRMAVEALLGRELGTVKGPDGKERPEGVKLGSLYGRQIVANVTIPRRTDGKRFSKVDYSTAVSA